MLIDGVFAGHPALAWLIGGLAAMAVEALAPGLFLVWVGLAAVGTGLVTLAFEALHDVAPAFPFQVVVFAALAVAAIAAGLRTRRPRTARSINTPGSGLLGRTAHLLPSHPVAMEGREGRVRIGDSDWEARLAAGEDWPEPSRPLEVVGVDGCVVVVRPRD